ncbi:MAG TPA: VOC family protein [Gammaproteobacteria bacterium]|nr:VOC family protein [Gammaproteobacteria bacterium]
MRIVPSLLLLPGILAARPAVPQNGPVPAPLVFLDIAGPDFGAQREFYSRVFHWPIAADGSFTVPMTSSVGGSLRQDPADKRFYIGVEDVAAKLEEIEAAGGTVEQRRFEVPGVAILGLFRDPAGNTMGLVEMENGRAKVP